MSRYKRLLSNTVILGTGTFASKVLVFLLMPLYTSVLSTSQFGVADILTQTANLLIPLASVGICDGMFRFALDTSDGDGAEERRRVFTAGLTVVTLGGVALIAAIQPLRSIGVFDGYLWLVASYVICANIHSAEANFIRAEGKTVTFAVQGLINTVLTIVLNILFLVVFRMGALGYVLSVVLSDLLVSVWLFYDQRLYRFISLRSLNKAAFSKMLRFSIPYIPTTMMWLVTSVSDRYIVTAFCGSAENGLYAAAYKIPTLLTLVCGVFIEAWQFSVVKDADDSEREGFFSSVYKNYMGIIFMGASVIIAGARIFTRLLLADSYFSSWQYIPVLVLATAFSALVSFLGSVYFLEKKSVMSMLTAMAGAVVNVILNFLLIPERGAMGAAIATFISYGAVYAIRAYDTRFYLRFDLHTVRLLVNTALLTLQAFSMVLSVPYWKYVQLCIMVIMLVVNGKDIILSIKPIMLGIIRAVKGKKS